MLGSLGMRGQWVFDVFCVRPNPYYHKGRYRVYGGNLKKAYSYNHDY